MFAFSSSNGYLSTLIMLASVVEPSLEADEVDVGLPLSVSRREFEMLMRMINCRRSPLPASPSTSPLDSQEVVSSVSPFVEQSAVAIPSYQPRFDRLCLANHCISIAILLRSQILDNSYLPFAITMSILPLFVVVLDCATWSSDSDGLFPKGLLSILFLSLLLFTFAQMLECLTMIRILRLTLQQAIDDIGDHDKGGRARKRVQDIQSLHPLPMTHIHRIARVDQAGRKVRPRVKEEDTR